MSEDVKPVVFGARRELDPEAAAAELKYKERIAKARSGGGVNALKEATPIGHIERPRMPILARETDPSMAPSGLTPEGGVAPRPAGSPVLSPQTQAQLQDMAKATAQEAKKAEKAAEAEKAKEDKEIKAEELFEAFDFNGQNEAERILNNRKRRDAVEARCEAMDFEDLLLKGEVRQRIPIIAGKFEPMFRSLKPEESLFLKRMLAKETLQNESYLAEKYSLAQLCCAVVDINGRPLPDHLDENGLPKEELFNAKMKQLLKNSGYVIADMGINYAWFDIRVRKLLNPDSLGNG